MLIFHLYLLNLVPLTYLRVFKYVNISSLFIKSRPFNLMYSNIPASHLLILAELLTETAGFAKNATKEYQKVCPFPEKVDCEFRPARRQNVEELAVAAEEEEKEKKAAAKKLATPFNYEDFFSAEIKKKKDDHTYRVFRRVSRCADQFPMARECPEPGTGGQYYCYL